MNQEIKPVLNGPFQTVLDTETTGLDPAHAHIIEVAAVVLDQDFEVHSFFSTLVNPGPRAMREASQEALRINEITPEDVEHAPSSSAASEAIQGFLAHYPGRLHSFPSEFDRKFLICPPWELNGTWGDCIQELATKIMVEAGENIWMRDGKQRARLKDAARFFGVNQPGAHRALVDAMTAAKIYSEILKAQAHKEKPAPSGSA